MVEIFQGHPTIFQRILELGHAIGRESRFFQPRNRTIGPFNVRGESPRTREENLLGVFSRDSLGVFFLGKKRRNSFGVTGCTWHRSNRIQLWEDTLLVRLREPECRVSWGFLGGPRERERETTLFSLRVSTLVRRPVLARTRFENSGLFKGNYRFYFRSARQFEFLIKKRVGNRAIRF